MLNDFPWKWFAPEMNFSTGSVNILKLHQPQKTHSTGSTIPYGWGSQGGERESFSWWEVQGSGGAGETKNISMPFFFNTICFLFSTLYTNYIQQGVNSGLFSIWRWVWASPRSCWWTGRPGVLQSMGSQRVRHDWVTELILFMGIMIQFHFFVFFITHVKYLFRDNEHVLPLLEKKEKMKMSSCIL